MPPHARYRAPAESGQKLAVPSWRGLPALLAENHAWREHVQFDVLGESLPEFAAKARAEVLQVAESLRNSDSVTRPSPASTLQIDRPESAFRVSERLDHLGPLIVTGHQPGLIHPGVWLKNFVVAEAARAHGGVGLQISIDADLCRSPSILVPSGTVDAPHFAIVDYDATMSALPWEERPIADEQLWKSFPQRVADECGKLAPERFLDEWWPTVVERGTTTGLLGTALDQARSRAEAAWGRGNLELAQSGLCRTTAFHRFALAILTDLPRFAAAYNGTLHGYRQSHRLRNHAHPVPDLATDGPWREAPFWIWTSDDRRRRPLFVRPSSGGLLASDRRNWERLLPVAASARRADAVDALLGWEAEGVKLRSRALITTMFIRLALADVFVHGIGGAKYDEATDEIARRFFGSAPPRFAAITGTLRLPIDHPQASADDVRRLRLELRELTFHPERQIDLTDDGNGADRQASNVAELIAVKRQWVNTPKQAETAAARHQGIVAANAALQEFVSGKRAVLERQLASATARLRSNRVLDSREYASCLFPRELLQNFFLDFPFPAR